MSLLSFVLLQLMEGTRKYVELLKGGIFFCVIGATFFLSMLQTHNTAVRICCALL